MRGSREGVVRGVARTATGEPLGSFFVAVTPDEPRMLRLAAPFTSPTGFFSLSLPAGGYTIRAGVPRHDGRPEQGGARADVVAGEVTYVEVVGASGEPGGTDLAHLALLREYEGGALSARERTPAVEVVEYDPRWPRRFAAERDLLADALPGARAIEHVGSTSVPGLCAKPTIDVMAVLDDLAAVAARVEPLARIGYEYRPGSFAADEGHMFLRKMADGKRTHHLHAVAAGSPLADGYRLFRDFLIANPEAARRYGVIKRTLAAQFAYERQGYVEEKERLVTVLMAGAREWRRTGHAWSPR
ncbi:GrpB family protein [Streptomyces sp. NPDC087270]|uniref:GrpB family protein n=1 Tax=Streptomyces sp. NPDC087270 TaxID=3365774 RepID=UPI00380B87F0